MDWARRRIRILIAAHGPRSLRLAGRIGDGVVIGLGVTPEVIKSSLELLEQGAQEAGRRLADLDVWFSCFWFVDNTPGLAKKQGSWAAASFASHFARSGVEGKFVPKEYQEGLVKFGAAYDYVTHGPVPEAQKDTYTELAREGSDQWYNLHLVHTNLSEAIAFNKTILLAGEAGVALYFVHVTGQAGVAAMADAHARGRPVYGAVLHDYLCYIAEDYKKPGGAKYQTYPALKTEADRRRCFADL